MTDQFDTPDPTRVERDHMGRPKIKQPDGSLVPYTRCTTYVGCLEDQYMVQRWRNRMVAIGLADRPDLLLQVAAHRDPADQRELNRIVDSAAEAGKANAAANTGTALHKLTERVDQGLPVGNIPGGYAADVEAYRTLVQDRGLKAHLIEPFTVNDDLKVGGTPDRLYWVPGLDLYTIGDTKSGNLDFGGLKFAMQMAVYAHSQLYDHTTGQRRPYPVPISLKWAVVMHLPQGQGKAELFKVDIEQGWEAVQVATLVRDWRNRGKKLITPLEGMTVAETVEFQTDDTRARCLAAIDRAVDREELRRIWAHADSLGMDTKSIEDRFLSRLALIEGSQR